MNQLQKQAKLQQLREAEERIIDIKATVHFRYGGFPRQATFRSHTEEDLYKQVFFFKAEHAPKVEITTLQYNGKNVQWNNNFDTYSHYTFAKSHMSFEQFKEACFNQPEKAAV